MRISASLLAIRPGEGQLIALLAALFAAVEAARGLGEVAADTLFISRFGAESLPYLFVGLGITSLVVALAYGAGIGRLDRRKFLTGVLIALAAVVVVERLAMLTGEPLVLPLLWLTVYTISALLLTIVWTVAGITLTTRQAKRLFPICTSAAIAGGFGGTLAAGPLAHLVGSENLLIPVSAFLAGAAALATAVLGRSTRPAGHHRPATSFAAELRAGFDYVRGSPLMRLVSIAYLLFAILLFSVSFPFLRAMNAAFDSEADLATALGLLSAAVTGVSFLVSLALANRIYARLGVTAAAAALPLVYVAGFGLWLIQFSLTTAIIVRFGQQVTQRGISNAAWSALYTVLPADRRPQVLAFVDGVPGQIGIALSGVLLLVAGALLGPSQIFVIGALTALAATWVVLRIRAQYGPALIQTLRAGLGEQVLDGGPGLAALGREPGVISELQRALRAEAAGSRRLAADLLGKLAPPEAAAQLVPHLDDPDPEVRAAVIGAMARLDVRQLAPHVPRLADDPSAAVRAEVAVALAGGDHPELAIDPLHELANSSDPEARVAGLAGLARVGDSASVAAAVAASADPVVRVRVAAVHALARMADHEAAPPPALIEALADDDPLVRRAASTSVAGWPAATEPILKILSTGAEPAQEAAVAGLDGSEPARDAVREWALAQLERATALRQHAISPSRSGADVEAFLCFVVENRRRRIEHRLLIALTSLGAAEADGPIRRALRSDDPDVRAQAIEALETIGDRRIRRAMVELLDNDRPTGPVTEESIRALTDDPEPWIRAVALRALRDRQPGDWHAILARLDLDADPILRLTLGTTAAEGGHAVPDTSRTLGELDRMLFLRRVPLFRDLAPEDLQRIAATATERLYPPDEAIVHEGELGDELVVIVEGEVLIVQGHGRDARLIRTYGVGDHIGELAIVRDQPRAATVVSGERGVRGLVIVGEALRAILRERPEAAMAMLATLADRLSTQ